MSRKWGKNVLLSSSVLYILHHTRHRERVGMVAKKEFIALAIVLVAISGCCRKCQEGAAAKGAKKVSKKNPKKAKMPRAGKELAFNDLFIDDAELDDLITRASSTLTAEGDNEASEAIDPIESTTEELAWLDGYSLEDEDLGWDDVASSEKSFKNVYFAFNKYGISGEQKDNVLYDADEINSALDEAANRGENLKVVVEAHSCHAAGDPVYNLALSQKRAAFVVDKLKEAGVPAECLQAIGRGQEIPAVVDGKPISGSRKEQWLNRRAEIYLVNA